MRTDELEAARTILLVPAPGDPHGLLTPGRHGARVPVMYRDMEDVWFDASEVRSGRVNPALPHALVLSDSEGPVPEGMARAKEVLARVEGCPFDPGQVVLADDLYRRERTWRLVAFRWSGHGRRWGVTYMGKPARLADCIHVPDLVAGDGTGLATVRALATILTARTGSEVVCLP